MGKTRIIFLDETDSTNSYLRGYVPEDGEEMTVAVSAFQTAGRGQGANTWESEAGKNLLFSILVRPSCVPAQRQFVLSMADALAQKKALDEYTDGITLKWPNDVYWRDCKISGTLIETSLAGHVIRECIIGTGLNVNQRCFRSDAPNPVSLVQILGHEVDIRELLGNMLDSFTCYYNMVTDGRYDEIKRFYHQSLYRREGLHWYEDAGGRFMAEISGVEDDGRLILRRKDGRLSRYAFKEVAYKTDGC